MSDITRLATKLMKLDDKLCGCMRCGLCQSVCPVFGATMKEADVSRGKLALLDNLAHEIIKDADAVDEKLNRCLLCGSCQANCPSGVKILDIFMEARNLLTEYRGLNPIKKVVFRQLLTHPDLFSAAMEPVKSPVRVEAMYPWTAKQGDRSWVLRTDVRDDRLILFSKKFNLAKGDEVVFFHPMRVVSAGEYVLPQVSVEAMYAPALRARACGGRVVSGH